MGIYVNPKGRSKESWLDEHGELLANAPEAASFDFSGDQAVVCLVNNQLFTAAGIAFDSRELVCFNTYDCREKTWYLVPKTKLFEIHPEYEPAFFIYGVNCELLRLPRQTQTNYFQTDCRSRASRQQTKRHACFWKNSRCYSYFWAVQCG